MRAMLPDIEGKAVVITGAGNGLGVAAARRLADHGARLVLGARRLRPASRELQCVSPIPGK